MNENDINQVLCQFEQASISQADATLEGNYKKGNKYYDVITSTYKIIKEHHLENRLIDLLEHEHVGVRLWSAFYLLQHHENKAIKVLKKIASSNGIHSLTASTTLEEWRHGNLKF